MNERSFHLHCTFCICIQGIKILISCYITNIVESLYSISFALYSETDISHELKFFSCIVYPLHICHVTTKLYTKWDNKDIRKRKLIAHIILLFYGCAIKIRMEIKNLRIKKKFGAELCTEFTIKGFYCSILAIVDNHNLPAGFNVHYGILWWIQWRIV